MSALELHEAVEELLRELNRELVATIKQRDLVGDHQAVLALRAIEIEERIADVAKLEQKVRRMP